MSKGKKKKNNAGAKKPAKKNTSNRNIVIAVSVGAVIAVLIALVVVINVSEASRKAQLYSYSWSPLSAKNASGDEADMADVYGVNYESYKGSLNFRDDGSFSLWMKPGDASDGTHTGTYTIDSDKEITLSFDDGSTTKLEVTKYNNGIESFVLPYGEYTVTFNRTTE